MVSRPRHGIAVREPAEASDDVGVDMREFEVVLVSERLKQRHTAVLIGDGLRMHQRHIDELPQLHLYALVDATRDRSLCGCKRQRIGCKGARIVPEHVAGELIEHDDERERAVVGRLPGRQPSRGCVLPCREKSRANVDVERVVLFEPALRAGGTPECNDLVGRDRVFIRHENFLQAAVFGSSSRRARRRILPTLVFGNSLRNSTCLARL